MDSHVGFNPGTLVHANVQEATTEFQKALTANGYLRARAIRMKLLHLHIAAITGVHKLTNYMSFIWPLPILWVVCLYVRHVYSSNSSAWILLHLPTFPGIS